MIDVLLINPPYSFTELVKLKKKKKSRGFYLNYPHLGLGYLAAAVRQSGFSVEIIDASANFLTEKEITAMIKEKEPTVVGITVTTQTSPEVYSLIKKIKKIKKTPEIVVGGPHVSALPESVKWMGVKFGFVGEAERGFVKLLDYLFKNKGSFKKIEGLVWIEKRKALANRNLPIKELDSLPFPARDLMENDRYFSPVHSGRITSMLSSRGCPFNCIYCSRPAIGRQVRFRSPKNIVKEMKEVVECFGVVYIEFVDDILTLNKERIVEFCHLIKKEKLRVNWGGQTRADLVDFFLLKKMKAAGCEKLSFGLETGIEEIRYGLNKKIPNKSYIKAFKWCHQLKIETNAFVMFGHPGETIRDMEESIRFTKKLDPDYAAFYITTILPGSILGEKALIERRIKPRVWKDYMLRKMRLPAYVPEGLTKTDLEKTHRQAFRQFYLRPSYIIKKIRKIKSFSYLKNTLRSGLAVFQDYILS